MRPTYDDVEQSLLGRWPESRLDPTLDRIAALMRLIGDPQESVPVVQLTGTNGKSSVARMIDALLRSMGLSTGRFTSPHLESMTERICIDGEPLDREAFVDAFADVAPFVQIVDDSQPHPMSFFETMVGMAYAAFADTPVDAAIVEVGLGGTWDATSVVSPQVAVITPIDLDHSAYLGPTPADIAVEKAGVIKPGTTAVIARQDAQVADVLAERIADVGAAAVFEGTDFGVLDRRLAVDGQVVTLQGAHGRYEDVFIGLHGEHQAHNAALALAAVEAFAAKGEIAQEVVRDAFAEVTAPARMEVVRRSPTILLDAAHNPHGAAAAVTTVSEAFTISPLVGVIGVMADKDVDGLLTELEPVLAHVVCTQNTSQRCLPARELGDLAVDLFGADRVTVEPRLDSALEAAIARAETTEGYEEALGSGGVLITGSVVTAGEARTLLVPRPAEETQVD